MISKYDVIVRDSRLEDLPTLTAIYNEAVLTSSATFDVEPQTMEKRRTWFQNHGGKYPIISAEIGASVVGYCSISRYAEKPGYSKTVELSVYIHKDFRRKGIATTLMREIIARATNLGYHAVISIIAGSNDASVELHKKLGFEPVGYLRQIGFKFDQWQDVAFYELIL